MVEVWEIIQVIIMPLLFYIIYSLEKFKRCTNSKLNKIRAVLIMKFGKRDKRVSDMLNKGEW